MNKLFFLFFTLLSSCQTVIDPSINAAEAHDFTIMASACGAMPGQGADICRVKENTDISSDWTLILPHGPAILGGEVTVYYKDISKTYAITNTNMRIHWADVIGHKQWSLEDDGEALAIATIRFKDNSGIERLIKARGLALLIVTKQGYDPEIMDSGFAGFKTKCDIAYTTAGRSSISCY